MIDQLAPFNQLSDMLQSLYADVFQPTELPAPSNDNEAQADADFERTVGNAIMDEYEAQK